MKKSPVIFYTEDDKDDQDIFSDILSNMQVEATVHFQNNGEELLAALDKTEVEPDILFLDLNMPRKTGFEVLEEIRAMNRFKNLAIVILSTSSDPDSAELSKKLGANLFITKPQQYSDFKEAVKLVLSIDWAKYSPGKKEFFINLNK